MKKKERRKEKVNFMRLDLELSLSAPQFLAFRNWCGDAVKRTCKLDHEKRVLSLYNRTAKIRESLELSRLSNAC